MIPGGSVRATGAGSDEMGRPEQHGKTEHGKKLQGKKKTGEVVNGRYEGGAFAENNQLAKGQGKRISTGMRLRNALRDQLGEDKVRKLTDELYAIAMSSELEAKDRLKAIDTLFGYAIGKPSGASALEVTSDDKGIHTVRFLTVSKDADGNEIEEDL